MLLATDIGNSNLVIGIYFEEKWSQIWRIPTTISDNSPLFYQSRLGNLFLEFDIQPDSIDKIIISSVVPQLTPVIKDVFKNMLNLEPIIIGPKLYQKLPLKILNPYQIGADLVANVMGATQLYGKDCIIVDFGTALTFTTLKEDGETIGVAIAPGLKTAASALYNKTAQLPPEVPMELPTSVLGLNTIHAIQSGVLFGYVGLVEYMVRKIREEVGAHFITIATGGLSNILTPLDAFFTHKNENLTLEGLRFILEILQSQEN